MARSPAWMGWVALIFALLAVTVVALQLSDRTVAHDVVAGRWQSTGATLATIDKEGGPRLIVTSLRSDGPARRAGLRVGDAIETVDGRPAPTMAAFDRDVAAGHFAIVHLQVRRNGQVIDIGVPRGPGESQ
ncbi:MAG: PDZ domain-containing protein [Rhizorhabdus sp.]|jgi:S1-C subfamily serine protease|uniref:PDZ domain-containing protein n=1 Tax=Rhizorhabdus sp. TaxID=1968843 RepID=UPI001B7CBF53|nr:PDZ domain-containing protein [Rhizorhabdus sp.]MBP8231735.1 PDZ domain-containing protein [Rhizorhabdus sp.]